MPSDILFEQPGWKLLPQAPANCECAWAREDGLVITLSHIGLDEGLRDRLSDVKSVRDHYRTGFAKLGIGLVECDVFELEGVRAVRAIGKLILKPTGAAYVGTIAMPLARESYVLDTVAEESGITGLRETAVMLKMSLELQVQGFALELPPAGQSNAHNTPDTWKNASTGEVVAIHWVQDPYDPEYPGPCLRNLADAPEHDSGFPQHPLSRVRSALRCLTQGIRFSP